METDLLWSPYQSQGLEHLHLTQGDEGYAIDSVVIGVSSGKPFRAWYEIACDAAWRVQRFELRLLARGSNSIAMQADGQGHWHTMEGDHVQALDGCIDVDITVTPFTNTLPIRRLSLSRGQSADLLVAYFVVPEMKVELSRQRYTCLESLAGGSIYKYEGLDSGFTADLRVDANGFVIDYPGLWKRV